MPWRCSFDTELASDKSTPVGVARREVPDFGLGIPEKEDGLDFDWQGIGSMNGYGDDMARDVQLSW